MIRAILLVLALGVAVSPPAHGEQVLHGKHYFHAPMVANGTMVATPWHPKPGSTIYIRQFQVYAFGQNPWSDGPTGYPAAWVSIQMNAASTLDMIGIAYLPLGKGKTVERREFTPYSLELGPSDTLLLEVYAPPGSPYAGHIPVFDVEWTDAP